MECAGVEATVAGGRLLGLSAGTRIGGVPAVVVSTTVSAAFAGGSTRVPQAALPAGLRIVPGDHATVGNLHRITLRRYGGPRSRPFEPAETFDEPVPYITEKGLQEVQAIHWDNWLTTDQWWTFEGMGDWETENRYYRLRFPWLADDLVDGILADYQEKGWPVMAWQIPGLDETWVSTRDDYGYWFLVVRLGDQVWSISTGTTEPTIDLAERYAAVLAEVQQKERGGAIYERSAGIQGVPACGAL